MVNLQIIRDMVSGICSILMATYMKAHGLMIRELAEESFYSKMEAFTMECFLKIWLMVMVVGGMKIQAKLSSKS